MGKESDSSKSQLVLEICSLSTLFISCSHTTVNSHFIDWFRILGVEEDADIDNIRKHYRKLALQLHPDKNKHPQAEIAFKLVLEAYLCLSDSVKRHAFNLERWKHFCIKCNRIPYASKSKESYTVNRSRSCRVLQCLKDIKERFKEEAKVMENCLKANSALRTESPLFNPSENLCRSNVRCRPRKESPIFDPSDYLFAGYPHVRTRIYKKPEEVWFSHRQNLPNYGQGTATYDSPIFDNRSVRGLFKTKSACVGS